MAIYMESAVTSESSEAPPGYTVETLKQIYGAPGEVNVLGHLELPINGESFNAKNLIDQTEQERLRLIPTTGYTVETLKQIYGAPGEVNVLTGTVTGMDERFIAYDMNSHGGCSGAIVFLLDQNQPAGLNPRNYGKAIAIHSGPHPDQASNQNIAFKSLPR